MVLLKCPYCELEDRVNELLRKIKSVFKERLTISVASTRVPTIFNRTRVFFSMILNPDMGQIAQHGYEFSFTWSSEAKDGGFELGSNLRSGCISYRGFGQ